MSNKIYEMVTEQVLAKLNDGIIPWVKPWNDSKYEEAYNADSGRCYTGINRLLLDEGGYMTFNQIKKAGFKLRKGSKGQIVVYWKIFKNIDDDGKEKSFPMLRYYRVFSTDMIEGYIPKKRKEVIEMLDFEPVEFAHNLAGLYLTSDVIEYSEGGNEAYYTPAKHSIRLPHKGYFKTVNDYYDTLFHEMGHATKMGLGRDLTKGNEEGVAELTSAFLMKRCKLSNEHSITNTTQYIAGWVKRLRADCKAIISISSKAEKAANYIMENQTEFDKNPLDVEVSSVVEPVEKVAKQLYKKAIMSSNKIAKAIELLENNEIEGLKALLKEELYLSMSDNKASEKFKITLAKKIFKTAGEARPALGKQIICVDDRIGICDGYRAFRYVNELPLPIGKKGSFKLDKVFVDYSHYTTAKIDIKKLKACKALKEKIIRVDKIVFSTQYLLDGLTFLDTDTIHYSTPVSPAYLENGENDGIVLPIRVYDGDKIADFTNVIA